MDMGPEPVQLKVVMEEGVPLPTHDPESFVVRVVYSNEGPLTTGEGHNKGPPIGLSVVPHVVQVWVSRVRIG